MSRMREDDALALVEDKFGSVEELGWVILEKYPEVLDGEYNLQTLSARLGLGLEATSRTLRSNTFRAAMSRLVVQSEFTLRDEIKHARLIKDEATRVRKGGIGATILAREHLARLEGRPLNQQKEEHHVPIQIIFGGLPDRPGDVETVEAVLVERGRADHPAGAVHTPSRAGDLPPPGARKQYLAASANERGTTGFTAGEELDFYSDESPYQAPEREEGAESVPVRRPSAIKMPPRREE